MPAEEPIQNLPAPINSDPPDGPTQMAAINAATVDRLNMRFASVAARDAALPNPVDGMEAITGSGPSAVKWIYVAGQWRRLADGSTTPITRTTYTDGQVFQSMRSGVTLRYARAVVDTAPGRPGSCILDFSISGVSVPSGAQNIEIGQLAGPVTPYGASPIPGYRSNGILIAASTGSGVVSLRYSDSSHANFMFFSTSYTLQNS